MKKKRYTIRKPLEPVKPKVPDDRELVIEQMRQRLKLMKVRAIPRPRNRKGDWLNPTLPTDITLVTDEALGRIHSEFACMAQYVQFQLALRAVEHAVSKREERVVRARIRLTKSGTNDDKAAKTEVASETRAASLTAMIGEAEEMLTQSLLDGYVIGKDVSSREMTRRMNTSQNNRS